MQPSFPEGSSVVKMVSDDQVDEVMPENCTKPKNQRSLLKSPGSSMVIELQRFCEHPRPDASVDSVECSMNALSNSMVAESQQTERIR